MPYIKVSVYCPHCGGRVFRESDQWGEYWQCISCSRVWDVKVGQKELPLLDKHTRWTESEKERKKRLEREKSVPNKTYNKERARAYMQRKLSYYRID